MAKKLQDDKAVRPGVLIAVAAVGVAAVAFFVVNLLVSHKGAPSTSSSTTITQPAAQPLPNLNIPTNPPPPPSSGRDPFQPVAGAGGTPAPVTTAAPAPAASVAPATTAKPEFQDTATKAYVQLVSVTADHKSAQIRDGTIVYEQARPGQTLDRGVVLDSITSSGCVSVHRGGTRSLLCAGNRVLM